MRSKIFTDFNMKNTTLEYMLVEFALNLQGILENLEKVKTQIEVLGMVSLNIHLVHNFMLWVYYTTLFLSKVGKKYL